MKRILLSFFLGWCMLTGWAQPAESPRISRPLEYEGYSEPAYEAYSWQAEYVTLPDGVHLAVDVLLPTEGPEQRSFPTIFFYTPYGRSYMFDRQRPLLSWLAKVIGVGKGPEFDQAEIYEPLETLLAHGYAVVVADMRGTGASFGSQLPLMPQLGKDGKELVDWIAAQPWCDGQVGMLGPSYLGWSQFLTAAQQPAALKCIMPEVIAFESFTGANRPGGIAAKRWMEGYSERLSRMNQNEYHFRKGYFPTAPVIDEDGDGKLTDERPLLDSAAWAEGAPPVYRDGQARAENWYWKATREHWQNVPVKAFLAPETRYLDARAPAPYDSISYRATSPGSHLKGLQQSGIAVYHVGGWFDGFTRGTTQLYATLAPTNPSQLLMAPRFHYPGIPKGYRKRFGYEGEYWEQLTTEHLRFFDHYLKGIENGIDTEAPVKLYVMNEGWRSETHWPPANTQVTAFFLGPQNRLQTPVPAEPGLDSYAVDFSHSASYGKQQHNRWLMHKMPHKQPMMRTEADQQCLVYETAPLNSPLRLIGHPVVQLWLSADQAYGDVFVYLSEVDEQGKATYISEGQLRAGWHELHDPDTQVTGDIDVQPELPWHGYEQAQWQDSALAGGKVLSLRFDLQPTAWLFRPGTRLRLSIAGADAENFAYHPNLCPGDSLEACPPTTYFIHRSGQFPSRIELPVIEE